MAAATLMLTKRCAICGRFRHYDPDDKFCVICGNDSLESECTCGRSYNYALEEPIQAGTLHCPRCGRSLSGRSTDFEP